ncbi:MAG: peptide transporter [Kiritimatiellae bacterium]|nr:peptide transporter [Verrucomicrobiota bacterium]MCG2679806.1 peptide transporter [Kiritimatiellia bacterium]
MARLTESQQLEEYRRLMEPPAEFADGFNLKTVIGALFLGFIMMPGAMYLGLVVGAGSISSAAQWVTIILFVEIARRSLKDLKMQEVYILYYMAGLAVSSPFQGLLWNQYFVQSDYATAMGIAQEIPKWVAPSADTIQEAGRTFFTRAWLAPIAMISLALVIGQLDNFGLGYVLYRITSDVEELPFPMAPVGASGIVALTETMNQKEPWRWHCFSIGGVIGMLFGLVYIALPSVTGSFLVKPLMLIPIPWVDFTQQLGHVLPAVPFNITFDLTLVLVGMVIPFWVVIGGTLGTLICSAMNPFLYKYGILTNWRPGMDVIDTMFVNQVDFYLSFGIGLTIAITVISLGKVIGPLIKILRPYRGAVDLNASARRAKGPGAWQKLVTNNVKRGDFSIFIALGIYLFTSAFWIALSAWLIEGFPWKFFVVYTVIYTPLISYACAKLEGMAGMAVSIPLIREATYILSGYRGVQIWFAPAPIPNYGPATVDFRIMELTGTKIIGKVKTMLVTIPIIVVASLIFSQMLWGMAEVPSAAYPFAQKMWDLQAKMTCLTMSATLEGGSLFFEAWRWTYFLIGLVFGVGAYMILVFFGMPTLMVFGLLRGFGQGSPAPMLFELVGALLGRFYFRKKFGAMWMKYVPVILAGYACGMGLVAMVGISIAILNKMMAPLIF